MRPNYVTEVLNGLSITHATVPYGEAQVETYALCNTVFYPPYEGQEEPVLSQDGIVNCKGCLNILHANK